VAPARFGTDGVRGVANEELTAELALALGRATARVLPAPAFVVGRDTRRSGPLLQAAFSAGLAAEGADVVDLGVLPTPGVAAVAERRQVPGAVISASHNPFGDNGIKLFSRLGTKLPTEVEGEIERALDAILADPDRPPRRPTGHGVGRITSDPGAAELYREQLTSSIEGRRLDGLHIVVDCANGAASEIAPWVLAELGARVTALHDTPDGTNINEKCGSTDPTELSLAVVQHQADLGLAFDGDADRAIAVDHAGHIVDGDVLLALFALDLAERGRLAENTVAVTVMTNLGFRLAMEARGIAVRETDVGDRHVLAALDAGGLSLGGEQSGHIIFRSVSTTGDGTLTGIALADLVLRSGRSLADLSAGLVERVPQRLVNVPIPRPDRLADCAEVWEAVVKAEAELGHEGRILLRPSGTEPLVRVMVEARDEAQANAVAAQLAGIVEAALGQIEPQAPR
jgi:phosphoglucosamine mutase